jgi:RimJ/RimL family protein N-acetyltransferase
LPDAIVTGNLDHAYLIAAAARCKFDPTIDTVISRTRDEKLLGGVIFTSFTGASISIHAAGFAPRWLNNNMLWIAFDYPFNQVDVSKVIGEVPSRNRKALDFNAKLGFKEEARIREYYPDADLVILSMRREDCRWLKLKPRGA